MGQADKSGTINVRDFDGHYLPKLKKEFCSEDNFLRCIQVSESNCKTRFHSLYIQCREKVLPQRTISAEHFESKSFALLGECLGKEIEKLQTSTKTSERKPSCQNRP